MLKVGVLTVRKWRRNGILRAYNPGDERVLRFCKAEVVTSMAEAVEDVAARLQL